MESNSNAMATILLVVFTIVNIICFVANETDRAKINDRQNYEVTSCKVLEDRVDTIIVLETLTRKK